MDPQNIFEPMEQEQPEQEQTNEALNASATSAPVIESEPCAEQAPAEEQAPALPPLQEAEPPVYETEDTAPQPPAYEAAPQAAAPKQEPAHKQPKHTGLRVAALALACALLGSIGGGTVVGYLLRDSNTQSTVQKTEEKKTEQKHEADPDFQASMTSNSTDNYMTPSQIYANYVDAVVGITNESITNTYGQISSTASSGTGFVITPDGYIVTNYHVVQGAATLTVTLHNGESYEAETFGYDATNDVALLKIDASGLTVAPLGDSDALSVGDAVAAIGNPLGELDFSMTVGYISALSRVINTDGQPINMMQTDTAINSGNSGGPLFDMHGNVVGITTAKYSGSTTTGTSIEGLGFVIPINDVKTIVADLQQYGYVTGQPYIGIQTGDIASAYVTYYNYPSSAYVDFVEQGSCGETAGLQRGDIITAIGENKIECYTDLVVALKQYSAGDTTTITVYRENGEQTLPITFDERQPQKENTATPEEETVPDFGGFGNIFP